MTDSQKLKGLIKQVQSILDSGFTIKLIKNINDVSIVNKNKIKADDIILKVSTTFNGEKYWMVIIHDKESINIKGFVQDTLRAIYTGYAQLSDVDEIDYIRSKGIKV